MNYGKRIRNITFSSYIKYSLVFIPCFLLPKYKNKLQMLSSIDIIKGEYENKLRIFSPIEKRFLIFGKIKTEKDKMSYMDFFESLVPFQNMDYKSDDELKETLGDEKSEFMKLFFEVVDTNKDGVISFDEYVVFCYFISNQLEKFALCLKNGKISKDEFDSFLLKEISSKVKSSKIKTMLDGRVVKTTVEELDCSIKNITKNCFSNKTEINLNDISLLKYKLFLILAYFEFYRIKETNQKKDSISMESLAKVFISYINIYKNKQYYENLSNYDLKGDISFNEFVCFFWFCSDFHGLKEVLKEKSISVKDLVTLANKELEKFPDKTKKVKFTEKHMKIFYQLLDDDSKYNITYIILRKRLTKF